MRNFIKLLIINGRITMTQQNKKLMQCKIGQMTLYIVYSYCLQVMINYEEFQNYYTPHLFNDFFPPSPLEDFNQKHIHASNELSYPSLTSEHFTDNLEDSAQKIINGCFDEHSGEEIPQISLPVEQSQDFRPSQSSQLREQKRKYERRLKNETKNIPKNFGKGIISFIEKNQKKIRPLLKQNKIPLSSFKSMIRSQKKTINTIADLRRLWTNEPYAKCMRIISNLFFRCYSLDYIFNSRICNYSSHIKYRTSLQQALKNPEQFNHIKYY